MPAKTYQQIQAEADRMFGKGASNKKFEWRRAQQAAAGLEQEKKTRSGLAGVYDRNKKLVSGTATALGFLFGGPGGAALARGAVQGLDRPGQGGIGFDVRRGLKGAAEGYAAGGVANLGKAALGKLFTGGASSALPGLPPASAAGSSAAGLPVGGAPGAVTSVPGSATFRPPTPATFTPSAAGRSASAAVQRMGQGLGQAAGSAAGVVGGGIGGAMQGAAQAAGSQAGASLGQRLLGLATNPQVLAGAAGGIADVMGQRSQQRLAEERLAQEQRQFQQQFDVTEEERKRRQAEANRLAAMFMPRS